MHSIPRVIKAKRQDLLLDKTLAQNSHELTQKHNLNDSCLSFATKDGHCWKISKQKDNDIFNRLDTIVEKTHQELESYTKSLIAERLSYLVNTTIEDEINLHDFGMHPIFSDDEVSYVKTRLIRALRGRFIVPRLPWVYVFDREKNKYHGTNLINRESVIIKRRQDSLFYYYEVGL